MMKTNLTQDDIRIGAKVRFNGGFPGTITEIYVPITQESDGTLHGMVVVRGADGRGSVCIGINDCEAR